jgi:hypothetical protein
MNPSFPDSVPSIGFLKVLPSLAIWQSRNGPTGQTPSQNPIVHTPTNIAPSPGKLTKVTYFHNC